MKKNIFDGWCLYAKKVINKIKKLNNLKDKGIKQVDNSNIWIDINDKLPN